MTPNSISDMAAKNLGSESGIEIDNGVRSIRDVEAALDTRSDDRFVKAIRKRCAHEFGSTLDR